VVGSSAALLLVVVLYFYLPESIKFLVLRKRNRLSVRGCHRAPDAIALELNADGFHSRLLGARNSARPQRVSGLIYPTAIRSLGAGWMHGIGRFGAIAAPLIGGWLISLHFSQQTLFSAPALPLPIGALAAFGLACLGMARFKGHRLDETAAAESKRAVGAAGVTALPQ
jgi:hypothetical protein